MEKIITNTPPLPLDLPLVSGYFKVFSPVDGTFLGEINEPALVQIDEMIQKAKSAYDKWSLVPVKDRIQVLFRFRQLLEQNIDQLSLLIHQENGKTKAEAKAEIEKGMEVLEFAISLPQISEQEKLEVSTGVDCEYQRHPLGVVLSLTPFNFPAMVPMWTMPIAIACGNAFILKPSEQVPLTPIRLGELWEEAGLPHGIYQVIHGRQTTAEYLIDHPGIQAVSFVGSTRIARKVYQRASGHGKRVLALGGAKNHLVVVPDADPGITVSNVIASAMGCAGQRCMAASVLILVGESEKLIPRLVEEARKFIPGQDLGAIISKAARERIEGYISRAVTSGYDLLLDGRNTIVKGKEGGNYVGPTIIDGVLPGSECACEEIFGPVLSIIRVGTLEEALRIENESSYGNAASIYTSSGGVARYFASRANAGMIGINIGVPVPREPFAFGGWNDSKFGSGDITGMDGVRFWTRMKKITTKWSAEASRNWMS